MDPRLLPRRRRARTAGSRRHARAQRSSGNATTLVSSRHGTTRQPREETDEVLGEGSKDVLSGPCTSEVRPLRTLVRPAVGAYRRSMRERPSLSPTLKAVSDAVLAVAAELSVEEVLQRLVDSARELAGARYAALGLPDGDGGFRRFLTSGMSDDADRLARPAAADSTACSARCSRRAEPYRTRDIHEHPRFRGWWPDGHPDMRSFLGVPIVAPEGVIGAFYLTEKIGAPDFTDEDEELIELLAAHAAIAIANARLYEQSARALDRRPSGTGSRSTSTTRSARSCSASCSAPRRRDAARARSGRGARAGRRGCRRSRRRRSTSCARSSSSCARPTSSATASAARCASTSSCCAGSSSARSSSTSTASCPPTPARDGEVLRIAQEALQNALRHADARAHRGPPARRRRPARARGRRRRRRLRPGRRRRCARGGSG